MTGLESDKFYPMCNVAVSVCVMSYNHERYIRQCLDGIVMQKVTFPFEIRVHDDASTDSSQDIIKEYQERFPDIVKPILQSHNQYSENPRIFKRFILPECEGKYVAFCEGDDYWTDPLKLQKQVEYMEAHPGCSMCFGNAIERWEDDSAPNRLFSDIQDKDYTGVELSERWIVPTASVVFRKDITESGLFDRFTSSRKMIYGDLPLWLTCAAQGTVHGFADVFCVYRRIRSGFMLSLNAQRRLEMGDTRVELYRIFGSPYRKSSLSTALNHYRWARSTALKEKNSKLLLKSILASIHISLSFPDVAIYRAGRILKERKERLGRA